MSCNGCGLGMPNTVRAPRTPLYQLGWLGDDSIDLLTSDIPDQIPYVAPDPVMTASFPTSPDYAPISTPGAVYGPPAPGQPGSVAATAPTSSIASAIANLFGPSAPGASPRVSTAAAPSISMGSALPILAIGVVGIVLLSNLGGKRRR